MHRVNNPGVTSELDKQPNISCPTDSEDGNWKLKARFGHCRTHNEQVIVQQCGIICSYATFFTAEAISNALVSAFVFCDSGSKCLYCCSLWSRRAFQCPTHGNQNTLSMIATVTHCKRMRPVVKFGSKTSACVLTHFTYSQSTRLQISSGMSTATSSIILS